ncbi:GNAT family N-acetyltransferase [Bradyrhizobium sp. 41S5]|uniref:hypothetical protein n=1 Tax=Bradyrhizobium sp. 41S5 TaxID=1404443 RepID=UPI00156B40C5|nr:hypothetical protein [Bradyrhizobium sp. 41S5]UFX48500.1 GNAT family N-acetyltransferase [Bradyrhizobium sp. 41S5]
MIATQPRAVTSELLQIASSVPEHRRDAVLEDINSIIETNWLTEERFWSRQHSPFKADHGIVLFHHSGECVAYLIVQRLAVAGTRVIYLSGTAVRDTYRGNGFFKRMFDTAMTAEFGDPVAPAEFCLCWRTRNPVIYVLGRAQCRSVVPAIPAGTHASDLDELCVNLAATLYPRQTIERGTMAMRGAYGQLRYRDEPTTQSSPDVDRWFAQTIPSGADAVFCAGWANNRWSQR